MSETEHELDKADSEYNVTDLEEKEENEDVADKKKTKAWRVSHVWKHFKPQQNKLARCNYCQKLLSFKTTVTNLKKHLEYKHINILEHDVNSSKLKNKTICYQSGAAAAKQKRTETWECFDIDLLSRNTDHVSGATSVKFSSEIRQHFEDVDEESKCRICHEVVNNSIEDMKNHLEDRHTQVLDAVIIKAQKGMESDNNSEEDNLYTEVVYLDEEIQPSSNRRIKQKHPNKKTRIERDSSFDEYISLKNLLKYQEEKSKDDLHMFLNYIKSLLKKISKESTPKLQLDIINLIINTQMNDHLNSTNS